MDSVDDAAHTRTGGSMVTLTPIDNISKEQIFQTSYSDFVYTIAVLVITVDKYPVEGIYINEDNLDKNMMQ